MYKATKKGKPAMLLRDEIQAAAFKKSGWVVEAVKDTKAPDEPAGADKPAGEEGKEAK